MLKMSKKIPMNRAISERKKITAEFHLDFEVTVVLAK